jgi:hypothetical protein
VAYTTHLGFIENTCKTLRFRYPAWSGTTNPKSLLMFSEAEDNDEALAGWPQKEKKAK